MNKYDIIEGVCPMPRASVERLAECLSEVTYPKGTRILEAGKIERTVFFVSRGIVRAYVEAKGREVTFWIGTEGTTVVSLKSYVDNERGYETVECVEDTVLYLLRREMLEKLFREDIHIANWGWKFAEAEFLRAEEKFIPLLFTTASERYEALAKSRPDLLRRIPLACLASYLGVTPVSLSRIRANVKKRSSCPTPDF